MQKKTPKVSLVGAGPGDPDLLTIKAWKALQNADVVLYDALASEELLALAPAHVPKIYVGKRAGQHSYQQDEINFLLAKAAKEYGHAVRLKGGDPFVFGRGYEEFSYLRKMRIAVEIIPGVSSCTSLTSLQGVPLTSRGFSQGFWVITGTTKAGKLSEDMYLAAQSDATVVVLMGMRKLAQISTLFAAQGKGHIPAMVIQSGSTPEEKVALGTVDTIVDEVAAKGIGTPGIIVIGKVAALHAAYPTPIVSIRQFANLHKTASSSF
ncbi:MAG: uroporphyrinogen-III C-methyltransferase [Bacteroidota bacterium]